MRVTTVESGNKIELPADWVTELGLDKLAVLEKTPQGILVQACPATDWDAIFDHKLVIGQHRTDSTEILEMTGDALIL